MQLQAFWVWISEFIQNRIKLNPELSLITGLKGLNKLSCVQLSELSLYIYNNSGAKHKEKS
jgi:hypothetical protein